MSPSLTFGYDFSFATVRNQIPIAAGPTGPVLGGIIVLVVGVLLLTLNKRASKMLVAIQREGFGFILGSMRAASDSLQSSGGFLAAARIFFALLAVFFVIVGAGIIVTGS